MTHLDDIEFCIADDPACAFLADDVRPLVAELRAARAIVEALADIDDPTVYDRDYAPSASCGLCQVDDPEEYRHVINDPALHERTCPWRMAKEWAAGLITPPSLEAPK